MVRALINNRLIGVSVHSYAHENVSSLDQVNPSVLDQVEAFFVTYNKNRGKKLKVRGRRGPKRAGELVDMGIKAFKKKKKAGRR